MNIFKKAISTAETRKLIRKNTFYEVHIVESKKSKYSIFIYNDINICNNSINMLKRFKHPNILQIVKYKAEKSDLYIKSDVLIHISEIYETSISYLHYVLINLADVIIFINKCEITHGSISFEHLYCKADGKIVLAGFEHAKNGCSGCDEEMFFRLLENVREDIDFGIFSTKIPAKKQIRNKKKISSDDLDERSRNMNFENYSDDEYYNAFDPSKYTNLTDFVEQNKDVRSRNIYFRIEELLLKFKLLTNVEKEECLDFITHNKDSLIPSLKECFVALYICELSSEPSEYNKNILEMIFQMDLPNYNAHLETLFVLPISQVRMFLLTNYDRYKDKVTNWNNKISENLILAIRCSDERLQIESIRFLTRIHEKLENTRVKEVIKTLECISSNEKLWEEALIFVTKTCNRIKSDESLGREFYRFVVVYLGHKNIRNQVLVLVFKIYKDLDIKKIQTELLPALCSYLGEEVSQDICFDLIEDVLQYLKTNKKRLTKNDWGVKKIGSMFGKISIKVPMMGNKNKDECNTSKLKCDKNKTEKEWDEKW